jgi:hypothetical protein
LRLVSQSLLQGDIKTDPAEVYLPGLLYYDAQNKIQILTDFGSLPSVKEFIIAHPGDVAIAKEIGGQLGSFLAALHVWGRRVLHPATQRKDGAQGISDSMLIFKNNNTARQLCAWRTGGRLTEIASGYSVGTPDEWNNIVKKLDEEVLEGNDTFNMGDFW